jgi:hypothetical protein
VAHRLRRTNRLSDERRATRRHKVALRLRLSTLTELYYA